MNLDGFEMREQHRALLARNRVYLLHNLRPTEALLSMLMAKEIFSPEMVDDIKSCQLTSEKIGRLLDLLPARGPTAFDDFCEALLECDHAHVADYLKTLEATDHFRRGIQPHCTDVSDHMLDRLVNIFKKSTPTVQRFAERKFALILEEQENDLHQREAEVKDLTLKNTLLQLEVTQLRSFMNSCTETMDALCNEVQRDFLSLYFLREEQKHLDNLKNQMSGLNGFDKVVEFYENMQNLLHFLEAFSGIKIRDSQNNNAFPNDSVPELENAQNMPDNKSMHDKLQSLVNAIVDLSDDISGKASVPSLYVRSELEKIVKRVQEIVGDVFKIKDVFKSTLRQKRKLESEVLSMLHSFQEMRRLEREVKEKQSHIAELNKQGQMMKKKTKHHRKHLEHIQLNVEQKRIQMREIQSILERHISSADQRLHSLLNLLPDLNENDKVNRSDTDLTFGGSSDASRLGTPASTERHAVVTPQDKQQKLANLNLESENFPVTQTQKPTKVTFSSTSTTAKADKGVTLTKIRPQGNKTMTPRQKTGLLKQRSNVTQNSLSSRKGHKTPNDGVKLKVIQPTSGHKALTSNANTSAKPEAIPNVPKQSQSPQDDIDKWVSEQQKSGKTQAIQRKLVLYQAQTQKTKEHEEEKEENIRNTLAKTEQQMISLEMKPSAQQPKESGSPQDVASPSKSETGGMGGNTTAVTNENLTDSKQETIEKSGSSPVAGSPLKSASVNSSSSASGHSRRSCNSLEGNNLVLNRKEVEIEAQAEATVPVSPLRRNLRLSHQGTVVESERGTASVTMLNAEAIGLPSNSQTSLRQSYPQVFQTQADTSHVKKQEHRQPLPTKQIMIRLPSK